MKTEIARFTVFLFALITVAVVLSGLRVQNRAYLYADSGIAEGDLQAMNTDISIPEKIAGFAAGLVSGDLGQTVQGEDVASHILDRFLPTLHLAVFAISVFSAAGMFLALLAVYKGRAFYAFFHFVSNLILSTPVFIAAVLLLVVFFMYTGLLPPGGYEPGLLLYVLMPGTALGMRIFARIFLFASAEAGAEEESSYITILRSRGYSEKRIVFYHIFRKILPVMLIYILLDFSSLLSGAIVVEDIFFFPGIGKSMYSAIKNMDENLLRALLFYSGLVFYFFNRSAVYLQGYLMGQKLER